MQNEEFEIMQKKLSNLGGAIKVIQENYFETVMNYLNNKNYTEDFEEKILSAINNHKQMTKYMLDVISSKTPKELDKAIAHLMDRQNRTIKMLIDSEEK